jgi:hypothetical protein
VLNLLNALSRIRGIGASRDHFFVRSRHNWHRQSSSRLALGIRSRRQTGPRPAIDLFPIMHCEQPRARRLNGVLR